MHNYSYLEEIKFPRAIAICLALIIFFTTVGVFVSPLDGSEKPIILSPEVKAMQRYRQVGHSWHIRLSNLDDSILQTLSDEGQGDLFSRSSSAQKTLEQALKLTQEVDRFHVPPMAATLHEQFQTTSLSYLEAARISLQWISAPEPENLKFAQQKLEEARALKSVLEKNPWMITP